MTQFSRPPVLFSRTSRLLVPCGNVYVTVCFLEDFTPIEVWITLGKSGGCAAATLEAIGRSAATALQVPSLDDSEGRLVVLERIVDQLHGIQCGRGGSRSNALSCVDAVGVILNEELSWSRAHRADMDRTFSSEEDYYPTVAEVPEKT